MTNLLWGLTAFLAVTGDFMGYNGGVRGVGAQYLLGLGAFLPLSRSEESNELTMKDTRHRGYHRVRFSRFSGLLQESDSTMAHVGQWWRRT